jgi:hypothetical protein
VIDRRDIAALHGGQADRRGRAQALVGEPVAVIGAADAEALVDRRLVEADALERVQRHT